MHWALADLRHFQEFTAVVECLPGTFTEENPPKYKPISVRRQELSDPETADAILLQAQQYILQRLAATY